MRSRLGTLVNQIYSPPDYQKWVVLLDGRRVFVRPICYTDKDAIRAMHGRLTPETRFLRFHYTKPELNEQELNIFCNVDYDTNYALVAEMFRHGHIELVGVGRYSCLSCRDTAEVSFVVEDTEQGNGIGTQLLNLLGKVAHENRIKTFVAELLHENVVMRDIFRKYAPDLKVIIDGNSCHVSFSPV